MQTKKKTRKDETSHTDDICCVAMDKQRQYVASGQVGFRPLLFIWDSTTCEMKAKTELKPGSRGITTCCFSSDEKFVACVDASDRHIMYIIRVHDGKIMNQCETSGDKALDIEWNKNEDGMNVIGIAAIKNMYFFMFSDCA